MVQSPDLFNFFSDESTFPNALGRAGDGVPVPFRKGCRCGHVNLILGVQFFRSRNTLYLSLNRDCEGARVASITGIGMWVEKKWSQKVRPSAGGPVVAEEGCGCGHGSIVSKRVDYS